ncbi:MAG TPA: heme-binding protein [Verrucomicrobiae bacterium]
MGKHRTSKPVAPAGQYIQGLILRDGGTPHPGPLPSEGRGWWKPQGIYAVLVWWVVLMSCVSGFGIGQGTVQPVPEWIGSVGAEEQIYYRKVVKVPEELLRGILLVAVEGEATLFVNGQKAGATSQRERAESFEVTRFLHTGTNVLAFSVKGSGKAPKLAVLFETTSHMGEQAWVISDASWKVSGNPSAKWNEVGFNDVAWSAAKSFGSMEAKDNPFDPAKAFDAYNSWKLASGAKLATDPATFRVPEGFRVELLRSALPEEGSWVSMAFDPQGKLTVAREKRGLLRMTIGATAVESVEVIEDSLLECRGLLYAHGALYVNANNSKAFVRLRDTDGDGKFDETKELLRTEGTVGHGRNHAVLGPDGAIYLVHGNDVRVATNSLRWPQPYQDYQVDQLIECPWDPYMFDAQNTPPGGHILKTDAEGKEWTLIAGGMRNPLDLAFNEAGEMFTFDADNEGDLGCPWYRPTRVLHVIPGAEFGWRRGTGMWPEYSPDALPAVVNIGVSSPTGIEFGTRSKFPAKYRKALFISDWSYGRVLAVHLSEKGASYAGATEEFLAGRPLNVTDVKFGPDGAMYVLTGGRGTQSGLYRVKYEGQARGEVLSAKGDETAKLREVRRELEGLYSRGNTVSSEEVVKKAWAYLGHEDVFVRFAARTAVEHQPVGLWAQRVLSEKGVESGLNSAMALARFGGKEHLEPLMRKMEGFEWEKLSAEQQLVLLRAYAVAFSRMGVPGANSGGRLMAAMEERYPVKDWRVNNKLCELLVYLGAPETVKRTIPLLSAATEPNDRLNYLFFLRNVTSGWTVAERRTYFEALNRAEEFSGGRYYGFSLQTIRAEVTEQLTLAERSALADVLLAPVKEKLPELPPAQFVKEWKMEELLPMLGEVAKGRSFENGRAAFRQAQCVACHRFSSDRAMGGSVVGPDLAGVSGRFPRADMLDHIMNPSKVIDEKFRLTRFKLRDGEMIEGTLEREEAGTMFVRANPLAKELTTVKRANVVSVAESRMSAMPEGLLNVLKREDVLDLLAYFEAEGNSKHTVFKK